jgi:hypothetical protein
MKITITPPHQSEVKTHLVYATLMEVGHIYTGFTGISPQQSRRGDNCIMIIYNYDANGIRVAPIKTRGDKDMVSSYQFLHTFMVNAGLRPHL